MYARALPLTHPILLPTHPSTHPQQTTDLAEELVRKVPAAALAGLVAALSAATPAGAADFFPPQENNTVVAEQAGQQSLTFGGSAGSQQAPALRDDSGLPEGNQWRYSEFIQAVQNGKVERVRFSKDGSMLQVRVAAWGLWLAWGCWVTAAGFVISS